MLRGAVAGVAGGVGVQGGMERAGGGAGAVQPEANGARDDDAREEAPRSVLCRGGAVGIAPCVVYSHRACAAIAGVAAKPGLVASHPSAGSPAAAFSACSSPPGG